MYLVFAHLNTPNHFDSENNEIIAATIGAFIAGLLSFLIFFIQRKSDKNRLKIELVSKSKHIILAESKALHREWIKSAEAEMLAKANELAAKYLKRGADDVDEKTTITTAEFYLREMIRQAANIDIYNNRASDRIEVFNQHASTLVSLLPSLDEKLDIGTQFEHVNFNMPKKFNKAVELEKCFAGIEDCLDILREKYDTNFMKLKTITADIGKI